MGILVFVMGMALMQGYLLLMKKVNNGLAKEDFHIGHVLFAGILGTTLYAQIFSLFYRVNLEANMVLMIVLALYLIWQHKFIRACLRSWNEELAFMGKI